MATSWNDKQPIYQQLKDLISISIIEGGLKEGEMIPSIRHVSADYQVNPLTVSKAYQALVDTGIIEKRRGLGMFVKKDAQRHLLESEKKRFIEEEWPQVQEKIKRLGLDIKELAA